MRHLRQLVIVTALSACALLLVALAVAAVLLALEIASPSDLWNRAGAFRTGLYATLLLGAGPALLLGAPGYWLLWRLGRARWLPVLSLGAGLGASVAFLEPAWIAWGVACGAVVAGLTHRAAQRWLGPDNSSKPTPLQGEA